LNSDGSPAVAGAPFESGRERGLSLALRLALFPDERPELSTRGKRAMIICARFRLTYS
jgi:hypothetical protein